MVELEFYVVRVAEVQVVVGVVVGIEVRDVFGFEFGFGCGELLVGY